MFFGFIATHVVKESFRSNETS